MKSDQHSSLLQSFKKEFTCPLTKQPIKQPVISIDGYSYEKQALKEWFRHQKTEPQTKRNLSYTELIPNRNLKALITKIKIEVPKIQFKLDQQKYTIQQLQEQIQDLKKEMETDQQLIQIEQEQEKPQKSVQHKEKLSKTKAIHKSIRADNKKRQERYKEKLKLNREQRKNSHQEKIELLQKIAQHQQLHQKLQEDISQKDQMIKQQKAQINSFQDQKQKMQTQIDKKTTQIAQMEKAQKENLETIQKLQKLQTKKTKLISKVKKGTFMINDKLRVKDFYENILIELTKTAIKKLNDSKPESEKQNLEDMDKIIAQNGLKMMQRLQQDTLKFYNQNFSEPSRTEKSRLFLKLIKRVKSMFHQKAMALYKENPLKLVTEIDETEDIEGNELGFMLNRIPYDERIGLQEQKQMDWTGVHSIVDSNVDEKRWRFLVDNCRVVFKDLRKIRVSNLKVDQIKLKDLENLSCLRQVQLVFEENSPVKNQLKSLVDANKELLKFVRIS